LANFSYDEHEHIDWIVTELLFEKDLFDFIAIKKEPFNHRVVRYLFDGILSALEHIHEKTIAHRDLKLENILFTNDGFFTLKVCDFGFATK
jgi:serine/threonine protein kinase